MKTTSSVPTSDYAVTMDDAYGDGSHHVYCTECGLCATCGDCKCNKEER